MTCSGVIALTLKDDDALAYLRVFYAKMYMYLAEVIRFTPSLLNLSCKTGVNDGRPVLGFVAIPQQILISLRNTV